jgi:hypothetical protein
VTLEAEIVNARRGHGFAVQFVNMTDEVRAVIERVIEWRVTALWHDEPRRDE